MRLRDIVFNSGGSMKLVIYGVGSDKYINLWSGVIDDIEFNYIPYGEFEIKHLTIIEGEDILQLHINEFEFFDFEEMVDVETFIQQVFEIEKVKIEVENIKNFNRLVFPYIFEKLIKTDDYYYIECLENRISNCLQSFNYMVKSFNYVVKL